MLAIFLIMLYNIATVKTHIEARTVSESHLTEEKIMENATLHVERHAGNLGISRKYKIFIDGNKRADISTMENCTFQVDPGHHEIIIKVDWCSSPSLSINIRAGEEIKVICRGDVRPLWPWYAITFGRHQCIQLYEATSTHTLA